MFIVLVAFVPRLVLLMTTGFGIEADEAIVGLMAKHVAEGRPWPVFYYGQPYMGSFESLLVAGMFQLFGVGSFGLKLVPLLFSLLQVALVYTLALRFTDRFGAFIASLLTAIGPSGLILWSTKARGGFIELVVLGTWALILAADILQARAPAKRRFLLLGAVLGFAWWVNNQAIFYLVTIALVFSWHFLFARGVASGGLRNSLRYAGLTLAGFFLGGAPFWYVNLFEQPRFSTVTYLLSQGGEGNFFGHLTGLFSTALPIIFGARRFWSEDDLFPFSSIISAVLYLFAYFSVLFLWASSRKRRGFSPATASPYGLLLLFPIVLFLIFSASGFGWLSKEPRYLLPIYSVLFILVGKAIASVRDVGGAIAAYGLFTPFLVINMASNYLDGISVPGQPFVAEGQRVAADQEPLYIWLAQNRYNHIYANYWIGYRTAFETGEKVTFSRFRGPQNLRIPRYEMIDEDERGYAPYVLVPREAEIVKRGFAERGLLFRESRVGGYVVLDHVRPEFEPGPELDLTAVEVSAPFRQDWARFLIDRDIGTRWGSGTPQRPGMTLGFRFPQPVTVSEIELMYGFFKTDAPRDLVIEGVDSSGNSCQLFDSAGARLWEELGARWPIFIKPIEVSELKLVQLGKDPVFDWSLSELKLYGAVQQEN